MVIAGNDFYEIEISGCGYKILILKGQSTAMVFSELKFACKHWKWAMTCDFQQCGILTCVYSDEPVQPPLKLRNSKLCSVSSLSVIECSRNLQRFWSDCGYEHIPHCWKSHAAAQIIFLYPPPPPPTLKSTGYYIIPSIQKIVFECPSVHQQMDKFWQISTEL